MTELEKAAASICGVHPDWSKLECFRIGFKEGAEWQAKQSPWISVEDRLPLGDECVIVERDNGYGFNVCVYHKECDAFFDQNTEKTFWSKDVKRWMQIPE